MAGGRCQGVAVQLPPQRGKESCRLSMARTTRDGSATATPTCFNCHPNVELLFTSYGNNFRVIVVVVLGFGQGRVQATSASSRSSGLPCRPRPASAACTTTDWWTNSKPPSDWLTVSMGNVQKLVGRDIFRPTSTRATRRSGPGRRRCADRASCPAGRACLPWMSRKFRP